MGRKRLHEVHLKEGEREELESLIRKGKASARSLTLDPYCGMWDRVG